MGGCCWAQLSLGEFSWPCAADCGRADEHSYSVRSFHSLILVLTQSHP